MLALHKHPTMMGSGMRLVRAAREVKGVGSLDVVGKAVGLEILKRVWEKFDEVMGPSNEDLEMMRAVTEVRFAKAEGAGTRDDKVHVARAGHPGGL